MKPPTEGVDVFIQLELSLIKGFMNKVVDGSAYDMQEDFPFCNMILLICKFRYGQNNF